MRTIQINYDLSAPGRNYGRLYEYLKGFDGWDHLLESLWLVRTHKTAAEVRDDLYNLVDSNDKVVVFDVTGTEWATTFMDSQVNWLYGHMAAAA
jgi:hypothetical protein